MSIGWKIGKLLIPLLLAGLVGYMSYRPVSRLRVDMPPAFVDVSHSLPSKGQVSEERIARAYWDCAVTRIQWQYSRAYLPPRPPVVFNVSSEGLDAAVTDPDAQLRYWGKLQEVWYLPSTWTESHEWDFGWLKDPVGSISARLSNFTQKLP